MELTRTQIMPGVWLSHLRTEKFKTACLSLSLLTQLRRETASLNALIPYVLRRGTIHYPDMGTLSQRMDELYDTRVEPVVRRIGEIQCLGFYASIPEDAFLPGGEKVLRQGCELLSELLLSPATRGGLLQPQYVDSEKEKLLDAIRSRVNDKNSYAITRCLEEMCCYEDYSAGRLGNESSCEAVHYQKLTKQYRALLQTSPIEIFYCGRAKRKELTAMLRDALSTLPRGEIDYEIGTDLRMNALEAEPRSLTEEMGVGQGKLVIGWRLGECMEDPDQAAIEVFNALFGGGTMSKLFRHVREERQLCYYADSMVDSHKGLLLVAAGIDPEQRDAAQGEIFEQLEAIRRGDISEEELGAAKAGVASQLRAMCDRQGELEGFYLSQILDGLDYGPLELAALAEDVTAQDLQAVARSLDCDQIYFLAPGEGEEEDDDGT